MLAVDYFGYNLGYITPLSIVVIDFLSLVIFFIYKTRINTALAVMVFIWLLIVVFNSFFVSDNIFDSLREVILWPLVFFAFFHVFSVNERKYILMLFIMTFLISSYLFYEIASFRTFALLSDNTLASVNLIYYVIVLIPWLFIIKSRWWKYLFFFLAVFLSIYSAKRTGIVIVICLSLLFLFYFIKDNKKGLWNLIIGAIISFVVGYFIVMWFFNIGFSDYLIYRFDSIEDDRGSGRFDIYENVWNLLQNSYWYEWLLGHGHNAVVRDNVIDGVCLSAHNDFLEILYDYGVVAFVVYLIIHFLLIKRVFLLKKMGSIYSVPYTASYLIFLLLSMLSHLVIYPTFLIFLSSLWGFMEAKIKNNLR